MPHRGYAPPLWSESTDMDSVDAQCPPASSDGFFQSIRNLDASAWDEQHSPASERYILLSPQWTLNLEAAAQPQCARTTDPLSTILTRLGRRIGHMRLISFKSFAPLTTRPSRSPTVIIIPAPGTRKQAEFSSNPHSFSGGFLR